jgi:hypothetical protein
VRHVVARAPDTYLGLDFVNLRCELRVGRGVLDSCEFCDMRGKGDRPFPVSIYMRGRRRGVPRRFQQRPGARESGRAHEHARTHTPAEAAFISVARVLLHSTRTSVSSARALTLCSESESILSWFATKKVVFPGHISRIYAGGKKKKKGGEEYIYAPYVF